MKGLSVRWPSHALQIVHGVVKPTGPEGSDPCRNHGRRIIMRTFVSALTLTIALLASTVHAQLYSIPTNLGSGADAEVRESNPNENHGSSKEIASRVASTRNSAIYTKFDVSGIDVLPTIFTTTFQMTYRNTNMRESRVVDTETPNPSHQTGLRIYGLDPDTPRANWSEASITYNNAPGITPDGNTTTKDFNDSLTLLGEVLFPVPTIGDPAHLLVGNSLVFSSAALDVFIANALGNDVPEITLVSTVIHEYDEPVPQWINFNYLFNPKEQTTLSADSDSPYSEADNSIGEFSPTLLIIVPEPTSGLLMLVGGIVLLCRWTSRTPGRR